MSRDEGPVVDSSHAAQVSKRLRSDLNHSERARGQIPSVRKQTQNHYMTANSGGKIITACAGPRRGNRGPREPRPTGNVVSLLHLANKSIGFSFFQSLKPGESQVTHGDSGYVVYRT